MLWLIFAGFCAFGTVQHFLFVPLGRPRWLLWLLPVSESPWEHYKLVFWPLGGALCLTGVRAEAAPAAILWAWLHGAAHGFCTMMGIYCFYRMALGACALFFVSAAVLPPENYPMFMEEIKDGRDQRTGTS